MILSYIDIFHVLIKKFTSVYLCLLLSILSG